MREDGIDFRPMIWSSEGRPHLVTTRMMQYCSQRLASRHEGADAKAIMRRWEEDIGPILASCRAKQALACMPKRGQREDHVLYGRRFPSSDREQGQESILARFRAIEATIEEEPWRRLDDRIK